jgi:hypothetical protein
LSKFLNQLGTSSAPAIFFLGALKFVWSCQI